MPATRRSELKETAQLYALPVCSTNLCHLPEHTTGAPTGAGYATIFSTAYAFAALRTDGSIRAWGSSWGGGAGRYIHTKYTCPGGYSFILTCTVQLCSVLGVECDNVTRL